MDFRAKQQVIEAIASEVNELHPLLSSVLDKLENIKSVEYTHGPNEKGADFVLTRFDPALQSFSHIGVIVKKGKIVNDFGDVARQIEECGLSRLVDGGKRKVRLSEIWVINTGSISANAKDKIHDAYEKQRIEFIDGEKLTRLVDTHANYFWHQVPSPIGAYLQALSRRIELDDKRLNTVGGFSCDDVYVEPDIQEIERTSYLRRRRAQRPKLVGFFDEVLRASVSVLEGEMGFGKSRIARRLAQHHCAPDRFKHSKVIPVYGAFRIFHERFKSLQEFIDSELGKVAGLACEPGYQVLVIMDGVDEAATNHTWKESLKAAITAAKIDPRLRLVLTTRPLRVLDENVDFYGGVRRFQLRPLSVSKVVQFIQQACESLAIPNKIYEDLQRSDLFKQLPQSPIAAALLSSLLAQNQNDLPSNLTELYSKSIEYMLGRWDVQKGAALEKEYQAAERVSLALADFMVENKLIWMSEAEARAIALNWHTKRNTGVSLDDLMTRVFEKSGIFLVDSDNGTVSFRHRSFGEYLYARNARWGAKRFEIDRAFEPYWVECAFFYVGLLGDCRPILEQLFDKACSTESEAWIKTCAVPGYALAGYQTEYSVVESNLHKIFIEAAWLYERIRRGDTKTKLTELPEMHLLWFFQRILRHSCDYEFLRPAITTTLLNLEAAEIPRETRLYALFFAACFAAELDDASGLEFIVKRYPTEELPLPISLAIKMETTHKKDFAKLPLIKAHERRLHQVLAAPQKRSSSGRTEQLSRDKRIGDLFDKPLKAVRQIPPGTAPNTPS